jgi:plasmid stabilization system protein ParE
MTIEFHEDAEKELQDAVRHYSEVSWAVVSKFEAEIKSVVATIARNPKHFHFTRDRRLRRANLRRFPYRILYDFNEEQGFVHVIVVCHQKRHPSYGLDRA